MRPLPFVKMHGLGNDFVVVDVRNLGASLDAQSCRALADRHTGIGCDQVIAIEPSTRADAFMRILNADGSEAGACGNAARCVASLLMREKESENATLETLAGVLPCHREGSNLITVDMGPARLDWREIPLAGPMDTLHLPVAEGPLADPVAVNMGNPHAVFFVADAAAIDLASLGPLLEHAPLFPERANIEVAEVVSRRAIRLRVWERGVGITLACGSGACATLVAAVRRGLTERQAAIQVDGGRLDIEWRQDGHVLMTGPYAESFRGLTGPHLLP
ncbi:MAG: diaminopimelate epimerase [Alphaproteobacteria bacterium]|nr:diaminopimelate epimerase [Alphaproteobacteria bacterium]